MSPRSIISFMLMLVLALGMVVACGDDEPTDVRPEDGSVEAWGSCEWDGSVTRELCADPLICNDYGVCMPPCTDIDHCAPYGFGDVCKPDSAPGNPSVCVIRCLPDGSCPDTGGAALQCDPLLDECH